MRESLFLIVGVIAGGLITWIVAHIYYRKTLTQVPEWAKPWVEGLPQEPLSNDQLLEYFQDALNEGVVTPDPLVGHVACPECKASAKDFEQQIFGDDIYTVINVSCPHCGWNETVDVS